MPLEDASEKWLLMCWRVGFVSVVTGWHVTDSLASQKSVMGKMRDVGNLENLGMHQVEFFEADLRLNSQ